MRRIKYLGSKESARELWENREALDKYLAKLKELMEPNNENMIKVKNDIPRRARIDLNTPVETAIRAAMIKVEEAGADVRLTEAIILLGQALDKVADYIDDQIEAK